VLTAAGKDLKEISGIIVHEYAQKFTVPDRYVGPDLIHAQVFRKIQPRNIDEMVRIANDLGL
jgi:hypothetical protein